MVFIQLKPYVATAVKLSFEEKRVPFGGLKLPKGGLDGKFMLDFIKTKLPQTEQAVAPRQLEIVEEAPART
jgi:hypothetical protein